MFRVDVATRSGLISGVLRGAWRHKPPEISLNARDLAKIAPLLLASGAGGLAWWRIRESTLSALPFASELHEAYRLHALQVRLYAAKIKRAFALLRSEGLQPLLIKGWVAARLYPEPGLRPYGDIDLVVSPQQYPRAAAVLNSPDHLGHWIDLHCGLERFEDRPWGELFARSEVVKLDDTEVRVLAPEDHLRVLCVHFLAHGAWRPLWLCDIAAALESVNAKFDWDRLLGEDKRRAKWISCTIRLAQELLGARLNDAPSEITNVVLPRWFMPTVLKQWEAPAVKEHAPPELIRTSLRHPIRLPKALRNRWPNPIEATMALGGSVNDFPRLPYQIARYLALTGMCLTRLPDLIRAENAQASLATN